MWILKKFQNKFPNKIPKKKFPKRFPKKNFQKKFPKNYQKYEIFIVLKFTAFNTEIDSLYKVLSVDVDGDSMISNQMVCISKKIFDINFYFRNFAKTLFFSRVHTSVQNWTP